MKTPESFIDDKPQTNTSLLDGKDSNPKLVIGDPLKRHINVGRSAPIMKIKVFISYMRIFKGFHWF